MNGKGFFTVRPVLMNNIAEAIHALGGGKIWQI